MPLILVRQLHLPAPGAARGEHISVAEAVALLRRAAARCGRRTRPRAESRRRACARRASGNRRGRADCPTPLRSLRRLRRAASAPTCARPSPDTAFAGSRTKLGPSSSGNRTGNTSATLVAPQPPSVRPRRPPSISRLPAAPAHELANHVVLLGVTTRPPRSCRSSARRSGTARAPRSGNRPSSSSGDSTPWR